MGVKLEKHSGHVVKPAREAAHIIIGNTKARTIDCEIRWEIILVLLH